MVVQAIGWSLVFSSAIPLLLLAYRGVFEILPKFPNVDFIAVIGNLVTLIVISIILDWVGGYVLRFAKYQQSSLEERVAGLVISNDSFNLDDLGNYIGLRGREVAFLLARLSATGKLKGYTIDIGNSVVSRAREIGQMTNPPSGGASAGEKGPEPSPTATKYKARLYELENLRRQNKISDEAYLKIKEDTERKLVSVESGTNPYEDNPS